MGRYDSARSIGAGADPADPAEYRAFRGQNGRHERSGAPGPMLGNDMNNDSSDTQPQGSRLRSKRRTLLAQLNSLHVHSAVLLRSIRVRVRVSVRVGPLRAPEDLTGIIGQHEVTEAAEDHANVPVDRI